MAMQYLRPVFFIAPHLSPHHCRKSLKSNFVFMDDSDMSTIPSSDDIPAIASIKEQICSGNTKLSLDATGQETLLAGYHGSPTSSPSYHNKAVSNGSPALSQRSLSQRANTPLSQKASRTFIFFLLLVITESPT